MIGALNLSAEFVEVFDCAKFYGENKMSYWICKRRSAGELLREKSRVLLICMAL